MSSVLPGTGSASPATHRITLNGNVRLGCLRTRTDATVVPAVPIAQIPKNSNH